MAKKTESLDDLINDIKDIVSEGMPTFDYERIPFSSPRMNYCTYGGVPIGAIVEFFGEESGGKTTTALDVVANYQKLENHKKIIYCDCENTLDAKWAKQIGVDIDSLILIQPKAESAEQIFSYLERAIKTNEVGLIVIDSLGCMVSEQALEKEITEKTYGGISTALTSFSNRIIGLVKEYKCTVIGINQMRVVIGARFPMENTPGGKSWKHACGLRLEFRQGKLIDEKGNEIANNSENASGNIVEMHIEKTKVCPGTRRRGSYIIKYLEGIDSISDYVDLGIKYGVINQRGAYFDILDVVTGEVKNKDKIQGQAKLTELLKTDNELFNYVKTTIETKMNEDE